MVAASSGKATIPGGKVLCQTGCGETDIKTITKRKKTNPNFSARVSNNTGKIDLNFIQINTSKGRQATNDLIIFSKKFTSPIMLVQEPYANGKNVIPNPTADIKVMANVDTDTRPRACIYHHKSLTDKLWLMDTLSSRDCTTVQTKIDNIPTLFVSCYMDRLEKDCPPDTFKKAVDYAKKHNMALISGTDANAHNTYWNSRISDKIGAERGDSLLNYIGKEKLFVENVGDAPTFDNGRWTNCIDLTITNAKGHDLVDRWQVVAKDISVNCSDHNFITYKTSPKTGFTKNKFRDIAKTDWQKYEEELSKNMTVTAEIFDSINTNDDIDKAAHQLAENVRLAFNSSCEVKYASNRVRSPPWETPQVREAKAGVKHRLRLARGTKSDKDWSELRSHQAEYHRLRNHTKNKKFKEFCQEMESKSTPKRISNIIKNQKTTRLGTVRDPSGRLTESPEETLKIMVDTHFTAPEHPQPADPVVNLNGLGMPEEKGNGEINSAQDVDRIFTPRRVRKSLNEFDPLSAAGPDGIRPVMLQRGWDSINKAFTNIARASYINSYTPACWSHSTGIFLPKPGKDDYYNPKSYRTITLAPLPLKWMERLILWHMEVDLKIYSKLSKKQYGFVKGASTETALHKIVHKIERAILNSGMALGTFLDIEGAFDNVAFSAIEKALDKKCSSSTVNKWIMAMIKSRSTSVEIQGTTKLIKILRGCPQGGILSPFLWNLVVDSLLSYTKDRIPCDLQGFADDLSLLATIEKPSANGKEGFDADTLRDITQRSLNSISAWCTENGLKISALKTHAVMFTWKRKWNFSKPLTVDNNEIEMKTSTKFLGVTLDSKLNWNEHISKQCKKTKGILMQCRKAVGPTWGFTPKTMKWIYTAIARPSLTYGAVVWINGLKTKQNINLLNSVQRLGNILITGALPSSPGNALNKINDLTPIDNWTENEALKGSLRLRANGHWIQVPMVNKKGNLTSHTKIIDKILNSIPLSKEDQDSTTNTLNLDNNFSVEIAQRSDYKETEQDKNTIKCYTDGSKLEDDMSGAAVFIDKNNNETIEEAIFLGPNATVFQAETYAVGRAASHLIQAEIKNQNIVINCDSQAAIMALDRTKLKSKTTLEAVQALNTLGENNQVLIKWIPAHSGFEGNEKADTLAKRGANNTNATSIQLPIPKATLEVALKDRSKRKIQSEWQKAPPSHFTRVWRDKFSKEIPNLNRGNLRKATMFLTGHATLNYHLNKYKKDIIPKTCPHCLANEETFNHYIGQCPKWSAQRSALFESFYLSVTDVADRFSLSVILQFINATGRLTASNEWQV